MSGGLVALLDDVAALARLAAASIDDVGAAAGRAGTKTAGVIVDDAAVTPRYVTGVKPERELPIIRKIATGSIRNKLLFILPVALALSEFLPWLLTPILMVGGTYLCYEGVEKIIGSLTGHHAADTEPAAVSGPEAEDKVVSGAVRTDFILSAEIMVIALNEVASEPFWSRLVILLIVAVLVTVVVYGSVGLIVKADDVGLRLAETGSAFAQRIGRGIVAGMPLFLRLLTVVGVAAMIWVGGHIWLVGLDDLGWHWLYDVVHHWEKDIESAVTSGGAALAWLTNTAASAVLGLVVGAVAVGVMHVVHRVRGGSESSSEHA